MVLGILFFSGMVGWIFAITLCGIYGLDFWWLIFLYSATGATVFFGFSTFVALADMRRHNNLSEFATGPLK